MILLVIVSRVKRKMGSGGLILVYTYIRTRAKVVLIREHKEQTNRSNLPPGQYCVMASLPAENSVPQQASEHGLAMVERRSRRGARLSQDDPSKLVNSWVGFATVAWARASCYTSQRPRVTNGSSPRSGPSPLLSGVALPAWSWQWRNWDPGEGR